MTAPRGGAGVGGTTESLGRRCAEKASEAADVAVAGRSGMGVIDRASPAPRNGDVG